MPLPPLPAHTCFLSPSSSFLMVYYEVVSHTEGYFVKWPVEGVVNYARRVPGACFLTASPSPSLLAEPQFHLGSNVLTPGDECNWSKPIIRGLFSFPSEASSIRVTKF